MNSVFHLKEKFEKSQTKKDGYRRQDINDGIFVNEKENEKEKKSTAKNSGSEKYFCKGNLMRYIIHCGKNLD